MNNDYLEKYMTETEEALGWLEDAMSPLEESENAMSMPESADETEPMETELEKAENVENAPHAAMTSAGVPPMQLPPMMPPASQPQNWMPCVCPDGSGSCPTRLTVITCRPLATACPR